MSCSGGVRPRCPAAEGGTEGLRRPEDKGDDGIVKPGEGDSDLGGIQCLNERRKGEGVTGLPGVKTLAIGITAKCAPSRYLSYPSEIPIWLQQREQKIK